MNIEVKMVLLIQLPPEIIHNILRFVNPDDLGWIAATCRFLRDCITGNNVLYRDIYLRILVGDVNPLRSRVLDTALLT